ncbi:beta-lactamase class C [Nitrobacteraceae bacterium AZCC 1564]
MSARSFALMALLACVPFAFVPGASAADDARLKQIVDDAVKPMIAQYDVPGLEVAVTIDGTRHFFDYGLASKEDKTPVTRDTLFELGSISKTFTGTLTAQAVEEERLSLNDPVTKHLPELKGSALDKVTVLDLATHTAGDFPLQLPDEVTSDKQLMAYYRAWKPPHPRGTSRAYANPSVGLLGIVTAKAMGANFEALAQDLFHDLGLKRTYVTVPASEMKSYAWGYRDDKPVRVNPGPIATEAYGVKSNAVDMLRFLEVNMGVGTMPAPIARAVNATHTGYFTSGEIVQDVMWEQYPYPVALDKLVAGNSYAMLKPLPATAIDPPMPPRADVLINKTGATNGFGAYVAFIPQKKIGIVLLANKNYPNEARVKAAYAVLSKLAE